MNYFPKISFLLIFIFVKVLISLPLLSQPINAGFRSSRILNSYPNKIFPDANYWIMAGNELSKNFLSSQPAGIWIVSLYWDNGEIGLDFPAEGRSYPFITFLNKDYPESYLSAFDKKNMKIWLQVEPGAANIDTLIDLVLGRYKKHKCIAGFGIDVEWYLSDQNANGKKVSDEEAERWERRVKTHNSTYTLFLKHFSQSWMPPNYRGNIIFVDDSQEFSSINALINEFTVWGNTFKPNKVWFQYGYNADKKWWSGYTNPMKSIGNPLITNISNLDGLFWVDFSITQIIPLGIEITQSTSMETPYLLANYPNPFNPETTIEIRIPYRNYFEISIHDITGKKIKKVWSGVPESNILKYRWNGTNEKNNIVSSGVYFVNLKGKDVNITRKINLLR